MPPAIEKLTIDKFHLWFEQGHCSVETEAPLGHHTDNRFNCTHFDTIFFYTTMTISPVENTPMTARMEVSVGRATPITLG